MLSTSKATKMSDAELRRRSTHSQSCGKSGFPWSSSTLYDATAVAAILFHLGPGGDPNAGFVMQPGPQGTYAG
jgi:hypothetical protein